MKFRILITALAAATCTASIFDGSINTEQRTKEHMDSLINLAGTALNSGENCRNSREYVYSKNPDWGCQAVQFKEDRRIELCQEEEVHNNCPISCGLCCGNDPDYKFERKNGELADCAWLGEKEERQQKYCDMFNKGMMVRAGCPKSCGYCKAYVSLRPSWAPTTSQLPTMLPTQQPTYKPSVSPTAIPTAEPTGPPTEKPSRKPTKAPTTMPSERPTGSVLPTTAPSTKSSETPTISMQPTETPSIKPSETPTSVPSGMPTGSQTPTQQQPSLSPSYKPSQFPTRHPSSPPTSNPTSAPSSLPSKLPTPIPSHLPSLDPTSLPSKSPSESPSSTPTEDPTAKPSNSPSKLPTLSPTAEPSSKPSAIPSRKPSGLPSGSPTAIPTLSPSGNPSNSPSDFPSGNPSAKPSTSPTLLPTSSPSRSPSSKPTGIPTALPTAGPSQNPSPSPTSLPTANPTPSPTASIKPTAGPTVVPTFSPSRHPTPSPSQKPSPAPTESVMPTTGPTSLPTSSPTGVPTGKPSSSSTSLPTSSPTGVPTGKPSASPTSNPSSSPSQAPTSYDPNLIMIITDEHNLRTLSCYRDYLLSKYSARRDSVDVWGDVSLDTPNIDILAKEGALFTNYYTVAPLCTPSRASFMTGLYPSFTGAADQNHGKLDANLKTWAEVLRSEKGYHTGYMGKWHLDGEAKPGWGNNGGRNFGFVDNKYRYNRGHWKYFDENPVTGEVKEYLIEDEPTFEGRYKEGFATDFLVDRGIEFIESAVNNDQPFALVISIPDPHGPNEVRPYYRSMYDDLEFKVPLSARKNMKYDPAAPSFNFLDKDEIPPDEVDAWIEEYENGPFWQNHMQQYYAMVKCIDYNIGKLLTSLKDQGIDDDTIIVFTSDHGDSLMEHGKLNKGRPYETTAGIPFLVRFPARVPAGKIIETAYSSIDFAPTILSLMGIENPSLPFQGVDGSQELLSSAQTSAGNEIIISYDSGNTPTWVAAMTNGYKLVVSKSEEPWLFDLNLDPEEMYNYSESRWHRDIYEKLQGAVIKALKDYNLPISEISRFIYLDKPACIDTRNVLDISRSGLFCTDIGTSIKFEKCLNQGKVAASCPVTCQTCCKDSEGLMFVNGRGRGCLNLTQFCDRPRVQTFCPQTCKKC